MSYGQKDVYSRVPYSSMSPLRLPLPMPSSRYVSVPMVQDADSYADEPDGLWYRKNTGISLAMFDSKVRVPPVQMTATYLIGQSD